MTLGSEDCGESREHGLPRDVDIDSVERGGGVWRSDNRSARVHRAVSFWDAWPFLV